MRGDTQSSCTQSFRKKPKIQQNGEIQKVITLLDDESSDEIEDQYVSFFQMVM